MNLSVFSRSACIALAISSLAFADPAMDAFLGNLKTVLESKDAAAMEALHDRVGATPADLARLRDVIASGFKYQPPGGLKSLEAVPLSEEYSFEPMIHNGERIEPSIKPAGMIKVEYDKMKSLKPYALKDGKPVLVGMKITKLDWKGPPDRPFWINVSNSKEKNPTVYLEGTFNASGVEMPLKKKHQFVKGGKTAVGSWGTGINAQHIISLKITTDGADGDLKVSIKEGEKPGAMPDKLVVEQAVSATKPLIYQGTKP